MLYQLAKIQVVLLGVPYIGTIYWPTHGNSRRCLRVGGACTLFASTTGEEPRFQHGYISAEFIGEPRYRGPTAQATVALRHLMR